MQRILRIGCFVFKCYRIIVLMIDSITMLMAGRNVVSLLIEDTATEPVLGTCCIQAAFRLTEKCN